MDTTGTSGDGATPPAGPEGTDWWPAAPGLWYQGPGGTAAPGAPGPPGPDAEPAAGGSRRATRWRALAVGAAVVVIGVALGVLLVGAGAGRPSTAAPLGTRPTTPPTPGANARNDGPAPFAAPDGRLVAAQPGAVAVLWWHRRADALSGRLRSAVLVTGAGARAGTSDPRIAAAGAGLVGQLAAGTVTFEFHPGATSGAGAGASGETDAAPGTQTTEAPTGSDTLTLSIPTAAGTRRMSFQEVGPGVYLRDVAALRQAAGRPAGGPGGATGGAGPDAGAGAGTAGTALSTVATATLAVAQDRDGLSDALARLPAAVTQEGADLALVLDGARTVAGPAATDGSSPDSAVCDLVPSLHKGAGAVSADATAVGTDGAAVETALTQVRSANAALFASVRALQHDEAGLSPPGATPLTVAQATQLLVATGRVEALAVAAANHAIDRAAGGVAQAERSLGDVVAAGHCPAPPAIPAPPLVHIT